jgi:type IX secretion system PorP/SprF family membrane protein
MSIFVRMKHFAIALSLAWLGLSANAQDILTLRTSLMHYQFNALPLNPAYAGRLEATSFEALYFDNFSSGQQVGRSALLSLHGRGGSGRNLGWGGVLQFIGSEFYNELNFRPAFSRIVHLANSQVSFGATLGLNYFDVNEAIVTTLNSSFVSAEGGLGAFWHNQRSFLGISAPNFFEKALTSNDGGSLPRARTVNLHAGSVFRLNDELYLKPVLLLRHASVYGFPEGNAAYEQSVWSADLHANVFIEGSYVIGLLLGNSRAEQGRTQNRIGASATLLFDNLRFGYAYQYNRQGLSAISLPSTHTLTAGYDFFENPAEGRRVF